MLTVSKRRYNYLVASCKNEEDSTNIHNAVWNQVRMICHSLKQPKEKFSKIVSFRAYSFLCISLLT